MAGSLTACSSHCASCRAELGGDEACQSCGCWVVERQGGWQIQGKCVPQAVLQLCGTERVQARFCECLAWLDRMTEQVLDDCKDLTADVLAVYWPRSSCLSVLQELDNVMVTK